MSVEPINLLKYISSTKRKIIKDFKELEIYNLQPLCFCRLKFLFTVSSKWMFHCALRLTRECPINGRQNTICIMHNLSLLVHLFP